LDLQPSTPNFLLEFLVLCCKIADLPLQPVHSAVPALLFFSELLFQLLIALTQSLPLSFSLAVVCELLPLPFSTLRQAASFSLQGITFSIELAVKSLPLGFHFPVELLTLARDVTLRLLNLGFQLP
jgi:hypothetical protein